MKMYKVFIEGWREHLVGKVEMEYLVLVFGDKAVVNEIELPSDSDAAKLKDYDEASLRTEQKNSY